MKTRRWWSRGHPIVWLTEKQPSKVGTKETKKQRKSDVYHVTHACESKWHMQIVTIPKLSPYHVVNLVILGEGVDKESTLSISSFPSRYRHLFPISDLAYRKPHFNLRLSPPTLRPICDTIETNSLLIVAQIIGATRRIKQRVKSVIWYWVDILFKPSKYSTLCCIWHWPYTPS